MTTLAKRFGVWGLLFSCWACDAEEEPGSKLATDQSNDCTTGSADCSDLDASVGHDARADASFPSLPDDAIVEVDGSAASVDVEGDSGAAGAANVGHDAGHLPEEPAECGDGIVQATEECDDGEENGGSCLRDCTRDFCGNGYVGPGELCDEGDANGEGDCSATCGPVECGSGIATPGVECDDGNTENTDSCLTSCLWNVCGDGEVLGEVTDPGSPADVEECDDGNSSNDDACTNECKAARCGDGFVGPAEECDDGNDDEFDDCVGCEIVECGSGLGPRGNLECDDGNDDDTDSCTHCSWNVCGDGVLLLVADDPRNPNLVEQCDDGNTNDNDTCTNACTQAVCGDGVVGPGEACDDANEIDSDGCDSCSHVDCGSGVGPRPGVECDDGNASNTDACLNTCVWNSCGDGFTLVVLDPENPNPLEECDDANGNNSDDCLNTCVLNVCGDGYLNPEAEDCDLGALNGPGSTCPVSCRTSECGDGSTPPWGECDDGNVDNSDSCLSDCTWNQCGDGAVYVGENDSENPYAVEECDDADLDDTNSCTSECRYNVCGDGKVLSDRSEPYDDPDGAGPMTASRLGQDEDGRFVPEWTFSPLDVPLEECDDGNDVNGDGCDQDCTLSP